MLELEENKKLVLYLLILIFTLAFLLRSYDLFQNDFWLDESFTYFYAKEEFDFIKIHDSHPPLFYLITKYFPQTVVIRYFSVILGLLSLYIIYLICKTLRLKESVILLSLLFCALNGYLIKYSQEYRMYSMLLFFSLLSFYLLLKMNEQTTSFENAVYPILFLFTTYCALLTHYSAFLILPMQFTYLVLNRKNTKPFVVLTIIALLCYVPQFLNLSQQIINLKTSKLFVFSLNAYVIRYFLVPFSGIVIFVVAVTNYFINKTYLAKTSRLLYSCLVPLLLLYLLGYFFLNGLLQARYNLIFFPYFMVFIADNIVKNKIKFLKYISIGLVIFFLINTNLILQSKKSHEVYNLYSYTKQKNLILPDTVLHESTFSYYTWKFYDTENRFKHKILIHDNETKQEWLDRKQTYGASLLTKKDLITEKEFSNTINQSFLYLNDDINQFDIFSMTVRNESGINLDYTIALTNNKWPPISG